MCYNFNHDTSCHHKLYCLILIIKKSFASFFYSDMEKFAIAIEHDNEILNFEVVDQEKDQREFEVFQDGKLMCTFEPNEEEYIKISRNQAGLDEEVIYMIADKIEQHHL